MGGTVGSGVGVGTVVGVGAGVEVGADVGVGDGVDVGIGDGDGDGASGTGVGTAVGAITGAGVGWLGVGASAVSGSESPQAASPTISRLTKPPAITFEERMADLDIILMRAVELGRTLQREMGRQRRNDITTPIIVDSLWAG